MSALRGQADEFLTKPVDPEQLVSVVLRLAEAARSRAREAQRRGGAGDRRAPRRRRDRCRRDPGRPPRRAGHHRHPHAVPGRPGRRHGQPPARVAGCGRDARRAAVPRGPDGHPDLAQRRRPRHHRTCRRRGVSDHRLHPHAPTTGTRTTEPCTRPRWSPPARSRSWPATRARRAPSTSGRTASSPSTATPTTKLRLLDCYRSQSGIRGYLEPDFVLATARYWSRFGTGKSAEPLEIIRDASASERACRPRTVLGRRRQPPAA